MSNFYKPRYKSIYKFRSKIWPYKNSKLWRFVDKRGRKRFRKGYWHRRYLALTSKKWRVFRFFLTSKRSFHWYKRKAITRNRHKAKEFASQFNYKNRLLKFQRSLKFYGKIDFHSFKILYYKSYAKKRLNRFQYFLSALEQRADVVLYRMRFLPTIFACHNFIRHYGILLNKEKINYPHYIINVGDIISIPKKIWHYFYFMFEKKIFGRLHRYSLLIQRRKKQFKKWKNNYLNNYWTAVKKRKNLNTFSQNKKYLDYPFWYEDFSNDIKNKKFLLETSSSTSELQTFDKNSNTFLLNLQSKYNFQNWSQKIKSLKLQKYFLNKGGKKENLLNNRLKIFLKQKNNNILKKRFVRKQKNHLTKKFVISYNSLKKKDLYFKIKKIKLLKHLTKIKKILKLMKNYVYFSKNSYLYWLYAFIWTKYQFIKYHYIYQSKKKNKNNLIFIFALKKLIFNLAKNEVNLNTLFTNKFILKTLIFKLKTFLNKKTKYYKINQINTFNSLNKQWLNNYVSQLKNKSFNLKNLLILFAKYYNFSTIYYQMNNSFNLNQTQFDSKNSFLKSKKENFYVDFFNNKQNYWFLKKNIFYLYQLISYLNIVVQYKIYFNYLPQLSIKLKKELTDPKNNLKYSFLKTNKNSLEINQKIYNTMDNLLIKFFENNSILLKKFWNENLWLNFIQKKNFNNFSNKEHLILLINEYFIQQFKNWKKIKLYNMVLWNKKSNIFYNKFFKYQYYQKFAKPFFYLRLYKKKQNLKLNNDNKIDIENFNNILLDSYKLLKTKTINEKTQIQDLQKIWKNKIDYKKFVAKKTWEFAKKNVETFAWKKNIWRKKIRRKKKSKKKLKLILDSWNKNNSRTKYLYNKNRHIIYWQIPLFYEFDFKTLRGGLIAKPTAHLLRGFFSNAANPQFKQMIMFLKKLGY